MTGDPGRGLMLLGAGCFGVGAVVWALSRAGLTLGRLPGDLRWQGEGWTVHLPLASSLVASIVLSLLFGLLTRR